MVRQAHLEQMDHLDLVVRLDLKDPRAHQDLQDQLDLEARLASEVKLDQLAQLATEENQVSTAFIQMHAHTWQHQ